jgi:hypothetical protein
MWLCSSINKYSDYSAIRKLCWYGIRKLIAVFKKTAIGPVESSWGNWIQSSLFPPYFSKMLWHEGSARIVETAETAVAMERTCRIQLRQLNSVPFVSAVFFEDAVIWGLTARTVETAETAVAMEPTCKLHVTAGYRGGWGKDTIEELLEEVFLVSPCRGYIKRTSCHYKSVLSRRLGNSVLEA